MAETTKERTPETEAKPTERDIFRFHDGQRQRAIDPMKVWFAMWSEEDIDLGRLLDRMAENELEAVKELLPIARKWFGIQEFNEDDESGMTDLEFCPILNSWFDYLFDLKKKRGQLPIPFRLLQQQPPGSPSVTKKDLDSSSTPSELPNEGHTTPFKPSPVPSAEA